MGHTIEEVDKDYSVLKILGHRRSSKKDEDGNYFFEYYILYEDASLGWEPSKHTTPQTIYDYWQGVREGKEIMWGFHCDLCNRAPSTVRYTCEICDYDLCAECNKRSAKMHRHTLKPQYQVNHTNTSIYSLISPVQPIHRTKNPEKMPKVEKHRKKGAKKKRNRKKGGKKEGHRIRPKRPQTQRQRTKKERDRRKRRKSERDRDRGHIKALRRGGMEKNFSFVPCG